MNCLGACWFAWVDSYALIRSLWTKLTFMVFIHICLLCFDIVGWATGRVFGLRIRGDGGDGHWLALMEWCPAGWSVCLPLLIFPCTTPVVLFWHRLTRVVPEKGRKTVVCVVVWFLPTWRYASVVYAMAWCVYIHHKLFSVKTAEWIVVVFGTEVSLGLSYTV